MRAALLLAGLLLVGAARAAEPEVARITWLAGDVAAVREAGRMERPSDRMVTWVMQRLPNVEHRRVVANARRSWMLIERGDEVCHAGAVRLPWRERLAYFSNTWLLPPLQLVVRAEDRPRLPLDAAGQVDLAALLADTRLRGIVVDGRSYGEQVDAQLARIDEHAPQLRRITSGDFGSNQLPMLSQRRADYAIEFPIAVAALAQRHPEVAQLALLPLQGADEPLASGVACPRTPWGLAAIRLIDRELSTPEGTAMLREGLMAQLTPELARRHRAQIDAFFQRRAQPTPGFAPPPP